MTDRDTARPRLLVVDDEAPVLKIVERLAAKVGFEVETCANGSDALEALVRRHADLAMVDLRMPDVNGLDLLRQIKATAPACEVVLMTGFAAVDSAVEAINLGARDYLTKPFDFQRLRQVLVEIRDDLLRRAQVAAVDSERPHQHEFCGMVGRSPAMQELFRLIERLAPHARVALVTGEAGTGKKLVARAFHLTGPREARPFVSVDCSAVIDPRFDGEPLARVPDAAGGKPGLFEAAAGGTLFLDEIDELSIGAQARLLRRFESGDVPRAGLPPPRQEEASVIAATSRNLRAEAAAGRFRSDLFYRLNVLAITVPPLRDRREDIPDLAAAFIRQCSLRLNKPLTGLTPGAERLLVNARWDANVRELKNTIDRACLLAEGTKVSERELTTGSV